MSAWGDIVRTLTRNPISTFAVVCVAATAVFLAYMTHRMVDVLESPDWCGRAVQAERITPSESFEGLGSSCNKLLTIQLEALSTGLHISMGTYSLALLVLVVVVVAGARASFKIDKSGLSGSVGKHEADEAAQHVADEAQVAADGVKDETAAPATARPDAGLPESIR